MAYVRFKAVVLLLLLIQCFVAPRIYEGFVFGPCIDIQFSVFFQALESSS